MIDTATLERATADRLIDATLVAFTASEVDEPDSAALGLLATADGLWLQRLDDRSMPADAARAAALRVADALLAAN